jgi:hypothetical protein
MKELLQCLPKLRILTRLTPFTYWPATGCGSVLATNQKFMVLFEENVVYGFRRNLLGLKWIGLLINAVVVAASIWMLWSADWVPLPQYGTVLVVGILHALFFLFGVSEKSVLDASDQYGRQLVLACETLMADGAAAERKQD